MANANYSVHCAKRKYSIFELRDAMDLIHKDELAGTVSVNDKRIADHLIDQIEGLLEDM